MEMVPTRALRGNGVNNLTCAPGRIFQVSRDTSPRASQDEKHELYFN